MKIIFLDIDGVLNSRKYDIQRGADGGNIDVSRLELLRKLIFRTGAKVVIASTWREHWDPTGVFTDRDGMILEATFKSYDIELFDKTPTLNDRASEIRAWLEKNQDVESFVIIDDNGLGWGEMAEYLVKTDYYIGRGLEEHHIDEAAEILMKQ